jgi:plastocyanin
MDSPTTEPTGTLPGEAATEERGLPTVTPTEYFEQDSDPLLGVPAPPPMRTAADESPTVAASVPSASSTASTQLPVRAGAERTSGVIDTPEKAPLSWSNPNSISIHLTVQDNAFSPSSLTVPAGAEVTIVFENQDANTPHSVVVYADKDSPPFFAGTVIRGPGTTTGTFTAPSTPGTYVLGCGVPYPHKEGTFIVE